MKDLLKLHRNKINRGTASDPLQMIAFCRYLTPNFLAASNLIPSTKKLGSPGC